MPRTAAKPSSKEAPKKPALKRPADRSSHPQAAIALAALGERLRHARVVRDIPMAEMAKRMGVTTATLSRLEHGAPGVSVETLALALWHLNLLAHFEGVCAQSADPEGERLATLRQPRRARGARLGGAGWDKLSAL